MKSDDTTDGSKKERERTGNGSLDTSNEYDEKSIYALTQIIQKMEDNLMASIQDALDKVTILKAEVDSLTAKIDTFMTEVTSAFNRLEQKIAIGSDTQPIVDALNHVAQSVVDKTSALDPAIAAAQVEGK